MAALTNARDGTAVARPPSWLRHIGFKQGPKYSRLLHGARGLAAAVMFLLLTLLTGYGAVCIPLPPGIGLGLNGILSAFFAWVAECLPGFVALPSDDQAGEDADEPLVQ